jgi:hypothetical protein
MSVLAVQRGQLDPDRLDAEDDTGAVAIAAVAAPELLHGVHRLPNAVARTRA